MRHILTVAAFLLQVAAFSQDIVITNYSGPTTFDRYEEFSGEITIKNTGIVGINNYFEVMPYLSTDTQLGYGDVYMQGFSSYSLAAGQSYTAPPTYSQGIDVAPGNYFLIIQGDYSNRIPETNETNNTLVIPITVRAPDVDFTLTSYTLNKATYTQNDLVIPSYLLENLGSTDASEALRIHFVLSADATYSSNDTHLYVKTVPLYGPDDVASDQWAPFALPTVANGNYNIIAWVDRDQSGVQQFEETNESNNVFTVPITIETSNVDLSITSADVFGSSGNVQVDVAVRNNGTTGVSGYSIGARLVPSSGISYDPYVTGNLYAGHSYLGPGEQKTLSQFFPITQTSSGTYFLQLIVNENGVSEANKSNNTYTDYSHPIYIAPPPIRGVAFNSLSTSGSVDDTDLQVNVNLNLTNTGNTSGFYQYYTVLVRNNGNTTVHSQQEYVYIDFSVGQTANKSVTLNLASALPVGTYQVSVSCASSCNTTPSTMNTTLVVSPTEYTLTGTVKGEDGQDITKGKLFLYQDDGSGNVRFIQKVVPYEGPSFSFPIDTHPHTLYFIPDPLEYPDYVPTIYGKTVMLQPGNFFTASANMNVTFDILKVNSLGSGTGIINGFVASGTPSGRSAQPQSSPLSSSSLPIILLSSGQVVGITYTDESGFYEFKNLPRGTYEVLLSVELDSPQLMDLYSVDIADKNMQVNFELRADGNHPVASQYFLPQVLTFSEFAHYRYGDPSIVLDAKSNTGLPIEYSSSNDGIAKVVNGEIVIYGVGTVLITAKQAGNTFYLPASIAKSLTIDKANQSLILSSLAGKTFGDEPFTIDGTSSAGLEVILSSSDPTIASVSGNTVSIHGAGIIEIIAEQPGNNLYGAAPPVHQVLTIEKAAQVISFDELPDQTSDAGSFTLSAESNSGLDITYESSDDEIVSTAGNVATILKDGMVNITARQSGNKNYHAAEDIVRSLLVNVILGIEELDLQKHVYPNPTTDFVVINIQEPYRVVVFDQLGRIRNDVVQEDNTLNFSRSEAGAYLVKFIFKEGSAFTRVVKK
ncbi:MAG TPA: CARDB domain-containing protein [Chryseolinea sp.]|nr:CARDB domain-containing protein [Chryseolinea sp.]